MIEHPDYDEHWKKQRWSDTLGKTTVPTLNDTLITAVWPARSETPLCSNFLKPCSSAATR